MQLPQDSKRKAAKAVSPAHIRKTLLLPETSSNFIMAVYNVMSTVNDMSHLLYSHPYHASLFMQNNVK